MSAAIQGLTEDPTQRLGNGRLMPVIFTRRHENLRQFYRDRRIVAVPRKDVSDPVASIICKHKKNCAPKRAVF
jgi:hypothetical protein